MELSIGLSSLLPKYAFSTAVAYIIIIQIYRRFHDGNEFVFTYFMFNSLIFFFAYILGSMDINIGFAFGLFAVFAILRYRTDPIPIKEMTYLFIVITLGVINAIGINEVSVQELLFANLVIIFLTFLLEVNGKEEILGRRTIEYDILENIKPQNHDKLLIDLEKRTGLSIINFEIGRVFLDRVNIKIFFDDD
ncbi:DUF4956 domain-containing protein [Candidatus Marinimicrobia bacterium]|nr:DUF4956 domain-containing protein [Candidatus Neomarinimicrobiota bacterium]